MKKGSNEFVVAIKVSSQREKANMNHLLIERRERATQNDEKRKKRKRSKSSLYLTLR